VSYATVMASQAIGCGDTVPHFAASEDPDAPGELFLVDTSTLFSALDAACRMCLTQPLQRTPITQYILRSHSIFFFQQLALKNPLLCRRRLTITRQRGFNHCSKPLLSMTTSPVLILRILWLICCVTSRWTPRPVHMMFLLSLSFFVCLCVFFLYSFNC
jgi:hypothetical protein